MVPRFEQLRDAAVAGDPALAASLAGELISSEIEIRSGRGEDLAAAFVAQRDHRRRLFALAAESGVALGATGTHPWADYREQPNIDTEHYRRVVDGLQYVARRNNTFSLHVHVGMRGADRAVQVCDRLRPVLPLLLALSANSPFVDGLRLRPAHGAHADVHEVVPPLRRPGRVRQLAGVPRVPRVPRQDAARSSSTRRCGGRSARTCRSAPSRCASATRRAPQPSRRRSRR